MSSDTKVIVGAIFASVVIVAGAVFVLGRNTNAAPKRESLGTASMTIDKKLEDFGTMKVSDEKTATFTITNTSESPLRLWNVATSCDCTFATVTIGGVKTDEFNMSMHMSSALKNWIGEVAPGADAILEVTYRPSVMPVSGPVSRQTTFATNDPNNPEVEVSVAATVE
jgi:hypothetical protein